MLRENFEGYTKKQVEGTIKACHLQTMLGHPSRKVFKGMVHTNLIVNCPVIPQDISHAHQLFGENLAGLRGKQSEKKPEQALAILSRAPIRLLGDMVLIVVA